ncbi:hypothetical protein MFIFM68171_09528 [Madurella fahalii]|uniref:Uncharacterized protein n=1 Tax=Madurella fahalii TaxID=1157608 RepID=A0ABQ0GNH3_9PEZI
MSSASRPQYDGSGQGGDATTSCGTWTGPTGTVTAGNGTGGDVRFGTGTVVPNADFKMSGKGGKAQANAGGAAKGGDGKGGSFSFGV